MDLRSWGIYIGIWTEGVQFSLHVIHVIHVISKSTKCTAWVQFEITRMISDQNCKTQSSITSLFISILKTQNSIPQLQDILLSSTELVFWKFAKVFFHSPLIWLGTINKPWNLIGCCVLLKASQWPGKRCDLEQKWFDSWINYTDESQWDCKDHQLFQNECNNTLVSSISRYFFSLMVQHLWSNFLQEKKIEKIRKWSVFGKT